MTDPDYRQNEWIAVLDVNSMDDPTLADTQRRLHNQGVKIKIKRNRRSGKITLWRWGGWRT